MVFRRSVVLAAVVAASAGWARLADHGDRPGERRLRPSTDEMAAEIRVTLRAAATDQHTRRQELLLR